MLQALLMLVLDDWKKKLERQKSTCDIIKHHMFVYLLECEGLVLLKGLLRQRAELSDFLHALLFLLEQHALSVGHFLQLLGVLVNGIILLLLNVFPSFHALYVVLDLSLCLVNHRIQI